jgi:hypothetical protein
MSDIIAIVGETGTGKTRSVQGLDSNATFLITLSDKKPSWMGWKKQYQPYNPTTKKGNFFEATSYDVLLPQTVGQNKSRGLLNAISQDLPHVKNIVIDDFQYLLSFEFMERAYEKGWDKFTEIARHAFDVLRLAVKLRPDIKVFILSHEEQVRSGNNIVKRKIKTIGNLLDDKITLEGLFTFVLFTHVKKEVGKEQPDYFFQTQTDGITTAKSPEGVFKAFLIENDLGIVSKGVDEYNAS